MFFYIYRIMKYKVLIIVVFLNIIIGIAAFTLRPIKINYDSQIERITFTVPPNFPKPKYAPLKSPVTPEEFKLGRILFYDPLLSMDQSISCANCHQSFAAFANIDQPVSHGIKQCAGTRNAPALFNLAWQDDFMWDGRINQLELTPLNAITNACEMANDLNTIISRLQRVPAYPVLFKKAFGDNAINSTNIAKALTQFMMMLVSANSKYDKHKRREPGGAFTVSEQRGYALFKQYCSTCHQEPLFSDNTFRNNGLELISSDYGRGKLTDRKEDFGKFRVPTLRNIEATSPYMHNGSLLTLNDVLLHYAKETQPNRNLDPHLSKYSRLGIPISAKDRLNIIAFLKTLTDKTFINDRRFQIP